MSDELDAMRNDLHSLKGEFHLHRGDVSRYMEKQNELMTQVVAIQARQEESSRSTRKLFEIYDKLNDRVQMMQIKAAGGEVTMKTNERVIWIIVSLMFGSASIFKVFFGG